MSKKFLHNLPVELLPPRRFHWSEKHKWFESKNKMDKESDYRDLLDALVDEDVSWTPYSDPVILASLPPSCLLGQDDWISTVPFIDFAIVETYHPDCVMQQFGKYQKLPPPNRSTLQHLHLINHQNFSKIDWMEYHANCVEKWQRRDKFRLEETRPYDEALLPDYRKWYKNATIPIFSTYIGIASTDDEPITVRLHRPHVSNDLKKLR